MADKTVSTKVVIGPVRFSYANVFEPSKMDEDSKPKYGVSVIISKKDKKIIKTVEAAIAAAIETGKGKLGKVSKNLKIPLRDGDEDREGDEAYENAMFFNASSLQKPGIVDADRNKIMEREEFYSGCYGYVSVNFYAYNVGASKGIAAGLNNIMKTKDGEALAGGSSAEDDFADLEVEEESGDLLG